VRLRNRDAPPIFGIFGAALGIVLLAGMITPQRWEVLGFVAGVSILLLRYLTPVSAAVGPGSVTFRWPLRTVVLTGEDLVTARVLVNGAGIAALGLRRAGSVRFGVRLERYDDPAALAAALAELIRSAPRLPAEERDTVLADLRRRADPPPPAGTDPT
jgi:hypothetical protein